MVALGAAALLKLPKYFTPPNPTSFYHHQTHAPKLNNNQSATVLLPVARLLGPSVFEASKLKVLFLGVDDDEDDGCVLPRIYTFTHCDITSKLTLAISQSVNTSQLEGWYHKFQRDEVVAEWKQIQGKMSLHVHCHISGGHLFLDLLAHLRYHIFCKELPLVLKAFVHGDENLFNNHPELNEAVAWVHFHSNLPHFNKVQCWGPLWLAISSSSTPPHPHSNDERISCAHQT